MKLDNEMDVSSSSQILSPAYTESEELLKNYMEFRLTQSKIPKYPKKLPGTIWALTTFFNPAKYKNKYENYKIFRGKSQKQGLKLLTVELSFNDNDYEIEEGDADILVRVKGEDKNILWQKEPMLNIALENLPDDCDKIIWIDCDIIFHNDNWVAETASLLEDYVVVQPFSTSVRLPKDRQSSDGMKNLAFGSGDEEMIHSVARGVASFGKEVLLRYSYAAGGHVGFVWSIRREAIEEIGFFSAAITGANDSVMYFGFYGLDWTLKHSASMSLRLMDCAQEWRRKIYSKVQGSVFYTNGIIDHLWHGSVNDRNFVARNEIITNHKFDPYSDISTSKNGLLEWATEKKALIADIGNYFYSRKEDG